MRQQSLSSAAGFSRMIQISRQWRLSQAGLYTDSLQQAPAGRFLPDVMLLRKKSLLRQALLLQILKPLCHS
jgi:hypothetical protein